MNDLIKSYHILAASLLGFNLLIMITWLSANSFMWHRDTFVCMMPMGIIISTVGWVGAFVVAVIFMAAIATTLIRLYPVALAFGLVAAIITFPLGSLGFMGFVFILKAMKVLECPNCGEILKKDSIHWDLTKCPRCKMTFRTKPWKIG